MSEYQVVYSMTEDYQVFPAIIISLSVFIAGIVLIVRQLKQVNYKEKLFYRVAGIFMIVWGMVGGYGLISGYLINANALSEKTYSIVEGITEKFDPMPYTGHKNESFEVKGILFEYTDYEATDGFKNTCSHGGPICRNGQKVRITYTKNYGGNRILKLEIKE